MSNVLAFRNFLKKNKVSMEEVPQEDGGTCFTRVEPIDDSNGVMTIVVLFNSNEKIVDLIFGDITTITNPNKQVELYKLINELNYDFRFIKFIVDKNGVVEAQYPFLLSKSTIKSGEFFSLLLSIVAIVKEEAYPRFMKLKWK